MKRSLKLISIILACLCFNLIVPVANAEDVLGDVDGDGFVTTVDARLALRASAKVQSLTSQQKTVADMNNDGEITLEDVKEIMSRSMNLETYEEGLLRKGFPRSYVEYLVELHRKYPEWEFVPMITGLDWQASVNGERSSHRKQLIENVVKSSFKCSCSSCKGVIQESPNWVSASEEAVKYYMDPRNFLTEEYIFQFESTVYDSMHTKEGVEEILRYTWMHDAEIKYLDATGAEKTYKEDGKAVKYSDAILKASVDSGMSAYYLASKMVQEVGSTSSSNAGGASGTNAPYNGIYNYYNIGAYTGVADGLKWANGFMKTSKSVTMYKSASTSGTKVVTVPGNTELYYISTKDNFYKANAKVGGKTYTGYVPKSSVSVYTSYGRPWTNPYKTIYYGAQYIFDSFGETQFTGYLQKFNVNPDSETLYGHEYMANVRAASFESQNAYKAYVSANILENKKVFSIPVFENMPGADMTSEDYFKASKPTVTVSSYTETSVTLNWTTLHNAEKYQVYKYNTEKKKYEKVKTTEETAYTEKGLSASDFPKYKVRGYYVNKKGETVYSSYSEVFEATVAPKTPTGLELVSKTDSTVKIKWSDAECSGYAIYRYDDATGDFEKIDTTTSTSYTDKSVEKATEYKYKIKSYTETDSCAFYSADYSSAVTVKTEGEPDTQEGYVNISDGFLNIRKSASTSADVIAELSHGHSLTITGTKGDWYKVTFILNDKTITGYAHKDYIKIGKYDGTIPEVPEEPELEKCPYTEPSALIQQGNSGDGVRWVQWYLYKLGYLEENDIDGDFGPTTLGAVEKFQTDKELGVDGLVGSNTRSALKSAYGA